MSQTREKWQSLIFTPWFCVELTFECMKVPWYFMFLFSFFFCLEPTVKTRHGCGSYFRSTILRVTGTYVQSSFSTTTRHIGNGIWKTLYSWRFYWHGSKYELIIFWVIIMKWKWVKVPGKLSVGQKYEPVLQRTLDQNDSLSSFSLKQN